MTVFQQKRIVFLLLALEICCLPGCAVLASSIAGPFKIIIQNLIKCPEAKQGSRNFVVEPRLVRDRNNPDHFLVSGNVTFKKEFSDDIDLFIGLSSWSSAGGWKDNAHQFRFQHLCKTMQTFVPKQFEDFIKKLYGRYSKCPYPPIASNVTDYYLNTPVQKLKQFIYGKYMGDVQFTTKGSVEGCIRAFVDVVPKVTT